MKKPTKKPTIKSLKDDVEELRAIVAAHRNAIDRLRDHEPIAVARTLAYLTSHDEKQTRDIRALELLTKDVIDSVARIHDAFPIYTPPPPSSYCYRAYPKWVDGMIVNSRREEWRHRLYKLLGLANRN